MFAGLLVGFVVSLFSDIQVITKSEEDDLLFTEYFIFLLLLNLLLVGHELWFAQTTHCSQEINFLFHKFLMEQFAVLLLFTFFGSLVALIFAYVCVGIIVFQGISDYRKHPPAGNPGLTCSCRWALN